MVILDKISLYWLRLKIYQAQDGSNPNERGYQTGAEMKKAQVPTPKESDILNSCDQTKLFDHVPSPGPKTRLFPSTVGLKLPQTFQ